MNFTNITDKVYFLTGTNSASFPIADLTAAVNNAFDRVASLILQADGRWQWDDTNQTDLPVATTTLVSGQADYQLAVAHLRIIGASVKTVGGIWNKLEPIDPADITGDRAEYYKTAGLPVEYDKLGSSVFLYPAPDNGVSVTLTAGLKVYFQRGPSQFLTSDTTKSPGFNSLYHDLLPLWASFEYCMAKGLAEKLPALRLEIDKREASLVKDYSKRDKDERHIMKMKGINFW